MSIDVDVIPTLSLTPCWGDIRERWKKLLSPAELDYVGRDPELLRCGSDIGLDENEGIIINNSYYLSLNIANTLSFTVISNEIRLDDLEFVEYLEDYGRNCDGEFLDSLVKIWYKNGHFYRITSFGGRSRFESMLFTALVVAIAEVSAGYIVLMNDSICDLRGGIYSAEIFKNAKPNF